MQRVLRLPIKKRWFDMILHGIKTEEYREIKQTITSRLYDRKTGKKKEWDAVEFTNGYGHHHPRVTLKFLGMSIGKGREDWGAEPGVNYYKISLGEIVSKENIQ